MEGLNHDIFQLLFGLAHQSLFGDQALIFLAKYLPYLLAFGFLVFAVSRKDRRVKLFIFLEGLLAVIIARSLITEWIRFFYAHSRPAAALNLEPLIHAAGNSFPSGHAAIFFALATTVYFFNRRLGSWFFILAFVNGLARIIAGVHWPLDLVGGALIGALCGFCIHKVSESYWRELEKPASISEATLEQHTGAPSS